MTRHEGKYAALATYACPHQGGPLGEGSIENGWLRCPWHGWDFHPTTGETRRAVMTTAFDTFPIDVREDGIYVGLRRSRPATDPQQRDRRDGRDDGRIGVSRMGLRHGRALQPRVWPMRCAFRKKEGKLEITSASVTRVSASFACLGIRKAHRANPAACLAIAGPGATNLLTGLWDANVDRAHRCWR